MNQTSAYDLLYSGMSSEDRNRLQRDISDILYRSAESTQKVFLESIQKAVTEMYNEVIVNPWGKVLDENANSYEFIESLVSGIWKSLLSSNPSKIFPFKLKELIKSWMESHPDDWSKVVNEEALKEIERLKQHCKFLESCVGR